MSLLRAAREVLRPTPPAQFGGASGARGAALLFMAPVIASSTVPLVTLPLYTRALSPDEYGRWAIAVSVGALASGVLGLGLLTGFERNYFSSNDETKRRPLLFSVGILSAGLQFLGFVALLALAPALSASLLATEGGWWLFAMGFGVSAIANLKAFFLTTLRSQGRAREYALFSVDETIVGAVGSLVCVLGLGWGAAGLLMGPLLAGAMVTVALVYRLKPSIEATFDVEQVRDVLRVSLPLAPRILLGAVGNQLDRLVLGAAGSLATVGLYAIGQRIAQVVFAFMTALQNVYQPRVYRMLFERARPEHIGAFLLPYAFVTAFIAVAAILYADDVLPVLAPAGYAGAAPIVGILSVHYGLMFFGKQPQLVYARRTGLISVLSIGSILLNSLAVYVGARIGAAEGVALGALAAGVVTGAVGLALATRFAPFTIPSLKPYLFLRRYRSLLCWLARHVSCSLDGQQRSH